MSIHHTQRSSLVGHIQDTQMGIVLTGLWDGNTDGQYFEDTTGNKSRALAAAAILPYASVSMSIFKKVCAMTQQ